VADALPPEAAPVPPPGAPDDVTGPASAPPPPPAPPPEPVQAAPPPAPPAFPQSVGASNATPVLPANSLGGVSRAVALFELIWAEADEGADGALDRIKGMCEAAIGDVGRFAPVAMRQAGADEAAALVASQ
jgi:hypothetical protein